MKCQTCNEKTASVHLTEIANKMKKEIHLCEACAHEHEAVLEHTVGAQTTTTAEGILEGATGGFSSDEEPGGVCRICGISFAEFRSTGRLGCSEDYALFRRGLLPILERIHGSRQHKGKVPPQAGKKAVLEHEIVKLNDELQRAVRNEKYEDAARLRDRIQNLEEEVGAD